MKNNVKEILNQLNRGEIDYKKAIKLIENIDTSPKVVRKKASRLKVIVVDEDRSIRIPAISFWLINFLIDIGLGLSSIALRFVKDLDEDAKKILNSIDSRDLKQIFKELKNHGPFDLVDIQDENDTEVKISIL